MSERTLERRCWRSRASDMEERKRRSSTRCSESTSRWRERLFCLRVEEDNADSESKRRDSWAMSDSRWSVCQPMFMNKNSSRQAHLLKEVLYLCFRFFFFF